MASAPVGALPAYRVDGADSPGIADAVAYDAEGRIEVIVYWNSDVDIDAERLNSYRGQLAAYQRHTGASRGFLMLMTSGKVFAAKISGASQSRVYQQCVCPAMPYRPIYRITTVLAPAWLRRLASRARLEIHRRGRAARAR